MYWLLGARDLPLIAGLVVVVTALEALAVPALERHAPLRGLRTRRDAWRHPRKYLLPAALLLARIQADRASWWQAPRFDPFRSESTRLNSSHVCISYAVFCLKKKKEITSC